MLGNRGITEVEEMRQIPDGTLAIDQLTNDQESVPVGERS